MNKKKTFFLLVLIGICPLIFGGCISRKAGESIGTIVVAKAMEQAFEPALDLAISTEKFEEQNRRWPNDYAELRSFNAANSGVSLTNYDRVDFTPKPDGSVGILAIAPGMTNQMTLSVPRKDQN